MSTGNEILKRAGYFLAEGVEETEGAFKIPAGMDVREVVIQLPLFNVGDVVRLKSGGPDMTVVKVQPLWIEVAYYTEHAGFTYSNFPPDALIFTTVGGQNEQA